MGWCCVPLCKSSSEKGFRLFRFPTDPERRKRWKLNCRRDKWKPTAGSCICELHFEETQYEQHRLDGKKLLKNNAVPTIFDFPNVAKKPLKPTRPPPKERITLPKGTTSSKSTPLPQQNNVVNQELEKRMEECKSQQSELEALRTENTRLKLEVKKYKDQMEQLSRNIEICFRPDQMEQLKYQSMAGSHSRQPWSMETITHAVLLRSAAGEKGYKFLRDAGYPFPSSRTLSRWLQCTDPPLKSNPVMET